jgi:2-oxo-4-hydroxy-4-carboxy-5-ureidoimidazoline decarboxylase
MRAIAPDPAAAARPSDARLSVFNMLSPKDAAELVTACCAAHRWTTALTDARPYRTVDRLYDTAATELAALDWSEILEALAAHPRIGEHSTGHGPETAWSRSEQAAVLDADTRLAREITAANTAYEHRFGHIFLIRAAGRTPAQILAAAHDRLRHDELTEQPVVRAELAQIVRLRLDRMLDTLPGSSNGGLPR